jgi:hypothetical protein
VDKLRVNQALETFFRGLSTPPAWVMLIRSKDGEALGRVGQFRDVYPTHPPLEDNFVASLTYAHAEHEYDMLKKLEHGNFQFSMSVGGNGPYIMINLMDAYVLAISYLRGGIQGSLDSFFDYIFTDGVPELMENLAWLRDSGDQ